LIPGILAAADAIGSRLPTLLDDLRTTFGIRIGNASTGEEAAAALEASVRSWLRDDTGPARRHRVRRCGPGLPDRHRRDVHVLLRRGRPADPARSAHTAAAGPSAAAGVGAGHGDRADGGYFYSRLVLLIINAAFGFFVLVAVGIPWLIALPLAIFQGFFAEFIPAVGTYIGRPSPSSSPWA
jgi:hypothetical protein